jgi:hypothetical protein
MATRLDEDEIGHQGRTLFSYAATEAIASRGTASEK